MASTSHEGIDASDRHEHLLMYRDIFSAGRPQAAIVVMICGWLVPIVSVLAALAVWDARHTGSLMLATLVIINALYLAFARLLLANRGIGGAPRT